MSELTEVSGLTEPTGATGASQATVGHEGAGRASAAMAAGGPTGAGAQEQARSARIQVGLHELSVVGLVSFSRAAACTRYAKDADRAPRMASRVALMRMSAWEVRSFERVVDLAGSYGVEAYGAAERFVDLLGDLDERLRPLDWSERLVKTYLAIGLLTDFGMALSDSLPEPLRSGLVEELAQEPVGSYATEELDAAVAEDPQLTARLGLWGRRVVGEEIGTLQRLLARAPELLGGSEAESLHTVLSQGAVSRMRGLGLRV